jgi:hypothetical protein
MVRHENSPILTRPTDGSLVPGRVARDDGHGFEIKGIGGEMMRVFSSRRVAITADLRARAARFEKRYGRKPSQRELSQLAQAANFKTRGA